MPWTGHLAQLYVTSKYIKSYDRVILCFHMKGPPSSSESSVPFDGDDGGGGHDGGCGCELNN